MDTLEMIIISDDDDDGGDDNDIRVRALLWQMDGIEWRQLPILFLLYP